MSATTEQAQTAPDKEAQEYWGYLFKSDKTGTDKLKNLLRGLHSLIRNKFESYDSADLIPSQLAHFYRELNGNYDPLFLQTPPATIAFIYKNLGCLHSLQPIPSAAAENRFSEPVIPALKLEGWIMWETIQLLLGPDEHAGFLMKAVEKWDIKDPETGKNFPKILPRSSFPTMPDAHMVAWYEGVSERLRREAEEEQSMRVTAVDDEPRKQIESAERHHRKHDREHSRPHTPQVEEEPTDSRRSAIAYFRNPLFRKEDGRPGVVRRESKHPTLVARGKSAAASVGNVVRNVASPHLWDGGSIGRDKDRDRERDRDRDRDRERDRDHDRDRDHNRDRQDSHSRRRKSLSHSHHSHGSDLDEDHPSARLHPKHAEHQSRRGSKQSSSSASERDLWDSDASPRHSHHHRQYSSPSDHTVRHSKSHDPTPSPRDYFPPYESYKQRRGSDNSPAQSPGAGSLPTRSPMSPPSRPLTSGTDDNIVHSGFMPTASPLFATQIARSEQRSGYYGQPAMSAVLHSRLERSQSPALSQPPRRSNSMRRTMGDQRSPTSMPNSPPNSGQQENGQGSSTTRPKVTRFETPAHGGHGRHYPREGQWR